MIIKLRKPDFPGIFPIFSFRKKRFLARFHVGTPPKSGTSSGSKKAKMVRKLPPSRPSLPN